MRKIYNRSIADKNKKTIKSDQLFSSLYRYQGLSHLDAEVVVWFSSAYKGTPESQNAAKKHT